MKRIGPVIVLAALAGLAVAGALAAPRTGTDSTTLVVNRQIGDMRMGESEAQVGYSYGSDCISGCSGIKTSGCVLGLKNCVGPIYQYKVEGGYLDVGYHSHRVVYLETNASRYQEASGLHVGGKIPFGSRWGPFRWHACTPSDGYWIAGTSWKPPLYGNGTQRWWTAAYVSKGVVTIIAIWRGDVNTQQC